MGFGGLSLASTDIPCSNIGTTVLSKYARVGKDCKSTFGRFATVSPFSFSVAIIFCIFSEMPCSASGFSAGAATAGASSAAGVVAAATC